MSTTQEPIGKLQPVLGNLVRIAGAQVSPEIACILESIYLTDRQATALGALLVAIEQRLPDWPLVAKGAKALAQEQFEKGRQRGANEQRAIILQKLRREAADWEDIKPGRARFLAQLPERLSL